MQSSRDYIRNVSLIHISLVLGQLIFLAVSIWVINPRREDMYDLPFLIAESIVIVIGIACAYRFCAKYAHLTKRKRGIREKLLTYRKGLFYQWAIFEFVTITSILCFLITGGRFFIFISLFSVVVTLINRPTIVRTVDDLELDRNEKQILETPDAAI